MKRLLINFALCFMILSANAQIKITVDPATEIKEISPYIFGKNNSVGDAGRFGNNESKMWQFYKDVGLKFFRESGGNNSTKYNWQRKLTCHPDWYYNVYGTDWDKAANSLQTNMPESKGMWALQLLGWAAMTGAYNFNDWGYNNSQWWSGVNWNLCGGGVIIDASKENGFTPGNPLLYLEQWPADKTVGILNHWFNTLKLNKMQFQYWNMDNEPEVWHSTHKDVKNTTVSPSEISAEEYIKRYVAVASKARELFPEIKIVGPSFTNEWFWYNWQNGTVPDPQNSSKKYSWVEYFIKRIAEEQQRTGMKLLDVLSFHLYPEGKREITLQLHRIFYDTEYDYPGANGVKVINGGWDNNITKEYIFKRSNDWLDKYMGKGHGVNMGITEMGSFYKDDPNLIAVSYASLLGTFAENNVELFTPWDWYTGQWETLHLFTRYTGTIAVRSTSSQNNTVSAYSSINADKNMLSVVLVNRDLNNSQSVNISIENKIPSVEKVSYHQLSNLPSNETFISATQNALKHSEATVNNSSISLTLPSLSVTVLNIPVQEKSTVGTGKIEIPKFRIYPNPAQGQIMIESTVFDGTVAITLNDVTGKIVESINIKDGSTTKIPIDVSKLNKGVYILNIYHNNNNYTQKIIKK